MDNKEKFEAWFNSVALCRSDFEDCLFEAWKSCAEQKGKEIAELKEEIVEANENFDSIKNILHDAQNEIAELKAIIQDFFDAIGSK